MTTRHLFAWLAVYIVGVLALALLARLVDYPDVSVGLFRVAAIIAVIGIGVVVMVRGLLGAPGSEDDARLVARLASVRIEPGDTLLIQSPRLLSREATYMLERRVEGALPEGCRALVLHDLTVIAALQARPGVRPAQVVRA